MLDMLITLLIGTGGVIIVSLVVASVIHTIADGELTDNKTISYFLFGLGSTILTGVFIFLIYVVGFTIKEAFRIGGL